MVIADAEQAAEQRQQIVDRPVQAQRNRPQRLLAGKAQQLANQLAGPQRRGADVRKIVVAGGARTDVVQQQFAGAEDDRDQIVEVVGDAAGKLAQGLELLRVREAHLQVIALGDLEHVHQQPAQLALAFDHRSEQLHRPRAAAARSGQPQVLHGDPPGGAHHQLRQLCPHIVAILGSESIGKGAAGQGAGLVVEDARQHRIAADDAAAAVKPGDAERAFGEQRVERIRHAAAVLPRDHPPDHRSPRSAFVRITQPITCATAW